MPVPRTNLFKGDRVRLNPQYVEAQKVRSPHYPAARYSGRTGTIVSDTLDPRFDVIIVQWDGCKTPSLRSDRGYDPDALELVE